MKKIVMLLMLSTVVVLFSGCETPHNHSCLYAPVFEMDHELNVTLGSSYDPMEGIIVTDVKDGDITDQVIIEDNPVDTSVEGVYTVKYSSTNSCGRTVKQEVTVNVGIYLANYYEGINLSNLPGEEKAKLYAAMEDYLLKDVIGGVPLYRPAKYMLYSSRLELYVNEYSNVLGFGEQFSSLRWDDTTVLMKNSTYGNANEFTFRDTYENEPFTLQAYLADESSTEDIIRMFTGSLYNFYFNEEKTSFEIQPEHAASLPVPVNAEVVENQELATIWHIPVRDDLEWKFNPLTDVSQFAEGYLDLDASDYIWTWQTALENEWFRAIAGGGDFVSQNVLNAQAYLDGDVDIEQVGFKLADGQTNVIEIEFEQAKTLLDVTYMFTRSNHSPIHQELYESLPTEEYGVDQYSIASSGPYYMVEWVENDIIEFVKNDSFVNESLIQYTGYQFVKVDSIEEMYTLFIDGYLDQSKIPFAHLEDEIPNGRLVVYPSDGTYTLNINGFQTEENRDQYIELHPENSPNSVKVPSPILGYIEMKQALFYGIDRTQLLEESGLHSLPLYTYFPAGYIIDPLTGETMQSTEAAKEVQDRYSEDNGYKPDDAVALFKQAVAKGIEDGYYSPGTLDNPTVIELDIAYYSMGNETLQAYANLLKDGYNQLFYDDEHHVQIQMNLLDVVSNCCYYAYLNDGAYDLTISGLHDYYSPYAVFPERYRDDNSTGFTMNWGIDTWTPNIEVTYTNYNNDTITEIWSYNALERALREEVYIKDGVVQNAWDSGEDVISGYLDMDGEELVSSTDGQIIGEYIIGSFDEIVDMDTEINALEAYIVTMESGKSRLFIIEVSGNAYLLYEMIELYTDPFSAIEADADYPLGTVDGQIVTEADVDANEYLQMYGFTSWDDLVQEAGNVESELIEVYAVTWNGAYNGSDVYIVLHIGDYYIGWVWL